MNKLEIFLDNLENSKLEHCFSTEFLLDLNEEWASIQLEQRILTSI